MNETKYELLKTHLRDRLRNGTIKPGSRLPSIRETASLFQCGKNTAIRAYEELEREHLIYAVPKSGFYAVAGGPEAGDAGGGLIDFAASAPDAEVMPYADFQHCLSRAVELYGDRLFTYADPQGFPSLRKAVSRHLADTQVFAGPERICIVSGSQQALHLLAAMPFPNGKSTILVEQPGYAGMLRSIGLLGASAVGIARTENGLDLDELERHFRSNPIKFFYTVPRFHNPLGTSLPAEQRKAIARLAGKYDVYVVEDDYLADLDADRKADPIHAYDRAGRVIHIRSFSKVTLPGLRIGAAVLPEALVPLFRMHKSASDFGTAALSQGALELYLESGMFGHHALRMKERYRSRMDALLAACAAHFGGEGFSHTRPAGGLFAYVGLPAGMPAEELAAILHQRSTPVFPAGRCFLPGFPATNGIRLSIVRTRETQIAERVALIRRTVDERLRRSDGANGNAIQWI